MDNLDREALASTYKGEDDLDREALNFQKMPNYKYAKWIKETQYEGGAFGTKKRVLIRKGEVRKIKVQSSDGYYILEGIEKNGYFGWVDSSDIQLMETKNG